MKLSGPKARNPPAKGELGAFLGDKLVALDRNKQNSAINFAARTAHAAIVEAGTSYD